MTRSVEGLHSHIARILKRAPASKLPYLSFELRAKQLLELAAYNPLAPRHEEGGKEKEFVFSTGMNVW